MIRSAKKKLLTVGVAASLATWITASIGEHEITVIDFTQSKEAAGKARWTGDLDATPEGLKQKTPGTLFDDSTIITEPQPLGVSWRPAAGARLRVVIEGIPTPKKRDDGAVVIPLSGTLFVRFGPDCSHWSGWQALAPEMQLHQEKGALFNGVVEVTSEDREAYFQKLYAYAKLDVPWPGDEEAAVKWILDTDPTFFEKHHPVTGWVQFRYEPPSSGTFVIKNMAITTSWGMSGLHTPPKVKDADKDRHIPWRFKASKP